MACCIPFPNLFPHPVPLLSMKQCHFTSHGNSQDNPQVQDLLLRSCLPQELTGSSCPSEKGLPAEQDLGYQRGHMVWPGKQSETLQTEPLVLWQQVAADESCPSIRASLLLSESWTFFPSQTSDLGAANSQPVPLRKGKVFPLPVASAVKLKF